MKQTSKKPIKGKKKENGIDPSLQEIRLSYKQVNWPLQIANFH